MKFGIYRILLNLFHLILLIYLYLILLIQNLNEKVLLK